MTLDDDVARLGRTRPFDLLPREALQLIAFSCEKRRLREGEVLFFPGETANSGYFVHSGAILLIEDGAEPKGERRVGAGALIGESALYAATARRVGARAAEDAVVMRIPARDVPAGAEGVPGGRQEDSRSARRANARAGRRLEANRVRSLERPARRDLGRRSDRRDAEQPRLVTRPDVGRYRCARPGRVRSAAGFVPRLSEGLVIQVVDFPDDETLDEMDAESEFDLLGLFRGRGLAQRGAVEGTGELPNMIWLYRRPLLDFWCDGEDLLRRS